MDETKRILITLPRAKSVTVHTGNIVNWSSLKRNITQSATEELSTCIVSTLRKWFDELGAEDKHDLELAEDVICRNESYLEKLPLDERQDYKITVKIFISSRQKDAIDDAISQVMADLGVSNIETVILSVPETCRDLCDLKEMWQTLEKHVDGHRIFSLGISDLNKLQLEQLHDAVEVKPCINQVNLTSCCVIPTELSDYAKAHDIQLLTHNDPPVILSADDCHTMLSKALTEEDDHHWQPAWVARYSVLITARGIIKMKGYMMRAVRD